MTTCSIVISIIWCMFHPVSVQWIFNLIDNIWWSLYPAWTLVMYIEDQKYTWVISI
jgi:hypothetical protein